MKSKHFAIASAVGIFGTILLFNINSAWADANKANGVLTVLGIVCYVAVIGFFVYKYVKQGGNPNRG